VFEGERDLTKVLGVGERGIRRERVCVSVRIVIFICQSYCGTVYSAYPRSSLGLSTSRVEDKDRMRTYYH
jgi:hypothetical protein